jgi:hypothetical protein
MVHHLTMLAVTVGVVIVWSLHYTMLAVTVIVVVVWSLHHPPLQRYGYGVVYGSGCRVSRKVKVVGLVIIDVLVV